MADATKYQPINGGTLISDVKSLFSVIQTRRTAAFVYGFMFAFIVFTVFLVINPPNSTYSPWFSDIFSGSNSVSANSSGSHYPSILSYVFPNGSPEQSNRVFPSPDRSSNTSVETMAPENPLPGNQTIGFLVSPETSVPPESVVKNETQSVKISPNPEVVRNDTDNSALVDNSNQTNHLPAKSAVVEDRSNGSRAENSNQTNHLPAKAPVVEDRSNISRPELISPGKNSRRPDEKRVPEKEVSTNYTASLLKKQNGGNRPVSVASANQTDYFESLKNCDYFDGEWVPDDSYPLYRPGSCALIDEQFNCHLNGRPDKIYQKMKWKPKGCNLPRLDGSRMLDLLKGKRLVFVGDSLNRNMWESLVCILKNSVKDQKKVFEAHGRHKFRGEASYSFIFKDYNCTLEFFVSPFLVREWEMPDKDGKKKETLRLDLVGRSSDQYKGADIIVFNTGHWWTHEKTARGKDYYQEGSHVYGELNVLEAFRKAITTWARWIDKNINPMKSTIFFRGYSASHFSGGQWNSGGQCDSETQPIKNETYLKPYPPKMTVLEKVLKGMKTPVTYLNITKMTDFRKDGHPSIYRKLNLSDEERRSPLRFQDCSHWCLPGVPDTWNEILYAELLLKQHQQKRS